MVNLPPSDEQPARAVEEHTVRGSRSHHKWGARLGRNRDAHKREPKGLLQLEALARQTFELMEKYIPKSDSNYHKAMDLLRLQYNMLLSNFGFYFSMSSTVPVLMLPTEEYLLVHLYERLCFCRASRPTCDGSEFLAQCALRPPSQAVHLIEVVIIISHLVEVNKRVNSLAMVKLPKNESYVPLPTGEMLERHQSNRNLFLNRGPSTLLELEELADIAANYMSTQTSFPQRWQVAMNRLRQLFNLEFKMRCHICGTAHYQDEITAPER